MGIWWDMEGYGGGRRRYQSGEPQAGLRAGGAGVRLHGPGLDEMLVRLR